MRLYRLLFFVATLFITYHVDAQNKSVLNLNISINKRNCPISEILNSIEKRANVIFSYNSKILNTNSKATVSATNKQLGEVLSNILPQDVGFKAISNNIILYKKAIAKTQSRTNRNHQYEQPKSLVADTVFVYKTDTVTIEKTRVDTLFKQIVKIEKVIDTVIQNCKPIIQKQVGVFYQHLAPSTVYSHWGASERNNTDRNRIDSSETKPTGFRLGVINSYQTNSIKLTYGIAWMRISENHYFIKDIDSLGRELETASKRKNVYNYLSFPLFAGRQFSISKNIDIEANAGFWINLKLNAKGYYLDISGDSSQVLSLSNAPLSKATIDLSANIVLSYKVLRNMSISLSPSYQYQVISDFRRSYPIAKGRKGFGVSVMACYNF